MLTQKFFTKALSQGRVVCTPIRRFSSKHQEIGTEPPTDPKQDTIFGKILRKEIKGLKKLKF